MATGNMTTRRVGHTATLLPSGKVLIAGGEVIVGFSSGSTSSLEWTDLASAELYDPSTGAFSPTGNMTTSPTGHTATLLADGQVLIAGGISILSGTNTVLANAELYDPSTGTFTATGNMTAPRVGHTATLLYDGRVLVVGDVDTDDDTPELYDPATGTFTVTGAFAGAYTSPAVDTATLLSDGTVLITGCDCADVEGPLVELYDPGTGTFSLTGGVGGPIGWWENVNTATLLKNGNVLIAGSDGSFEMDLLYEPSTRVFSATGSTIAPHEAIAPEEAPQQLSSPMEKS